MNKQLCAGMEQVVHDLTGCMGFWVYRSPYDRTCRICKRHEQQMATVFRREDDSGEYIANSWWEVMFNPGAVDGDKTVLCDGGVPDVGKVKDEPMDN